MEFIIRKFKVREELMKEIGMGEVKKTVKEVTSNLLISGKQTERVLR